MTKRVSRNAPSESFSPRGRRRDDIVLLGLEIPDFQMLRYQSQEKHGHNRCRAAQQVLEIVNSNEITYHKSDLTEPIFKPTETQRLLPADDSTTRELYTYSNSCRLEFASR